MKVSGSALGVLLLSHSNQTDCFAIRIFEKKREGVFPRNMIFV
jgi:hypothetical protein